MEASNKNNEILGQSNLLKDSTNQKARGVIPFAVLIFFLFLFLALPCGRWDFMSSTKNQNWTPCIGCTEP